MLIFGPDGKQHSSLGGLPELGPLVVRQAERSPLLVWTISRLSLSDLVPNGTDPLPLAQNASSRDGIKRWKCTCAALPAPIYVMACSSQMQLH